jgi:outer membrane receptor for ferrienterochelin and colicins
MKIFFHAATLLSLCAALPVAAQTAAQTARSAAQQNHGRDTVVVTSPINPVVVTGTGTHTRLSETAIPVKVISGEELTTSGVGTLEAALLKLDPSFSTVSLATMGNTLSMNGLEGKYILFMVNGQRMIGAGNDAPDLSRIDLANVRRIEILDGAASTLYGSDAIAGVVNIITEDGRRGVDMSARSSVRNHGRTETSINLDVKPGRFGSYTSYTRQQQGGWILNPMEEDKNDELIPTTKLASFPQRSDNISQRFTFDFTDRLSAWVEGSYYDYKQSRPLTVEGRETSYGYDMLHNNYTYGAGLNYVVSGRFSLSADFHSDNYSSRYAYTREDGDFKPGDRQTRLATSFTQATVKGIFTLGRAHKLSAGVEYLNDRLDDFIASSATLAEPVANYTLAAFAQDEIRLGHRWQAVVGGRVLHHQVLGTHATPTAALMFSAGPVRLRASYANGYKTPVLSDIHTFFVSRAGELTIGDENLRPEKSNYASLNAEYTTGRFTLSATGYVNDLRDKIESVSAEVSDAELARYQQLYGSKVTSNTVKKRSNIDRARVAGATIRAKADLGGGFMVSGSYNYTDGRNLSAAEGEDDRLDKLIPHSAAVGGQWSRTWGRYRLTVDLDGRYSAPRYSTTYSPRFGDAPAYSLWDLVTTHTFTLGRVVLSPSAGIENIFDYRDDRPAYMHYLNASGAGVSGISPYATLTPGRTFYLSLGVRFR